MLKKYLQKWVIKNFMAGFLLLNFYSGTSQVSISGPVCVIPGKTYHYIVHANWSPSSTMRICITGGKLVSSNLCTPSGMIRNMVFVIWDSASANPRKVALTSSLGNIDYSVTGTTELKGGVISDSDRVQVYDTSRMNYLFRCTASSGGDCSPIYSYQWQKSINRLSWTNINGATNNDLQFSGTIQGNTFFRRVTIETHSNIVAYSEVAMLTFVFQ